jgi:hypothetical protein
VEVLWDLRAMDDGMHITHEDSNKVVQANRASQNLLVAREVEIRKLLRDLLKDLFDTFTNFTHLGIKLMLLCHECQTSVRHNDV